MSPPLRIPVCLYTAGSLALDRAVCAGDLGEVAQTLPLLNVLSGPGILWRELHSQ